MCLLGKSCKFSSGSFSFANLVSANATNHIRARWLQLKKRMKKELFYNQTLSIKIIALINGFAALLHLFFWIIAFIRLPSISLQLNIADRINLATTYGFGIADFIWSVPLLLIGSIGLWKKAEIGWLAALLANVLYWYSFTVIIIRDFYSNSFSPGMKLFLPFVLISFWTTYFLWKNRNLFLRRPNLNKTDNRID